MLVRRVVLASALACGACSLITDLGGLSSGGAEPSPDAATADGAAPLPDAAIQPSDAATGDASRDAPPSGASGFCQGKTVTLCEDFDLGIAPSRWSVQRVGSNQEVKLLGATDTARAPNVLRSRVVSGATEDAAYLEHTTGGGGEVRVLRYAFDLKVVAAPTAGAVEINAMIVRSPQGHSFVFLKLTPTGLVLVEQTSMPQFIEHNMTGALPPRVGTFQRVSIVAELTSTKVTMAIDGQDVPVLPAEVLRAGNTPTVAAGITWSSTGAVAEIETDNLVFSAD